MTHLHSHILSNMSVSSWRWFPVIDLEKAMYHPPLWVWPFSLDLPVLYVFGWGLLLKTEKCFWDLFHGRWAAQLSCNLTCPLLIWIRLLIAMCRMHDTLNKPYIPHPENILGLIWTTFFGCCLKYFQRELEQSLRNSQLILVVCNAE